MPLGRFSQAPKYPSTGKGGFVSATTDMAAMMAAAPAMSVFMFSIPCAVLMESPPESKVMALPTSATPFARAAAFPAGT